MGRLVPAVAERSDRREADRHHQGARDGVEDEVVSCHDDCQQHRRWIERSRGAHEDVPPV
jgi:hypothetical protein